MFIAPLLPFLADAIIQRKDSVIPQSPYKGFGNIRSGSNSTHTRNFHQRINGIGGKISHQIIVTNRHNRNGIPFNQRSTRYACNNYFSFIHKAFRQLKVQLFAIAQRNILCNRFISKQFYLKQILPIRQINKVIIPICIGSNTTF